MRRIINVLIYILVYILSAIAAEGANITATGGWSETIDAFDLQAGAGSDLIDRYESNPNAVRINITGAGGGSWRVDISKMDDNWDADFHLYARRTSGGIGSGTISGGTSYMEVEDFDKPFFSGSRNRWIISVQLRLTGVSVQIPPDTYSTDVVFTVVDI